MCATARPDTVAARQESGCSSDRQRPVAASPGVCSAGRSLAQRPAAPRLWQPGAGRGVLPVHRTGQADPRPLQPRTLAERPVRHGHLVHDVLRSADSAVLRPTAAAVPAIRAAARRPSTGPAAGMPCHRGRGHTDARNRVDQPAHRGEPGTMERRHVAAGRGAGHDERRRRLGHPPAASRRAARRATGRNPARPGLARGHPAAPQAALRPARPAQPACPRPARRDRPSSGGDTPATPAAGNPGGVRRLRHRGRSQPGHPGKLLSVSHCRHVHTAHGRHVRAAHRRRQLPRPDQGDHAPAGPPPTGGRRRRRHLDRHPDPVRAAGPPVVAGRQHQCGRRHLPARATAGDLRRRGLRRHLSA